MKVIRNLFFIFMIGFISQSIHVYAISGEFEHNDVHYSIEKIYMEVYQSKLNSNHDFIGYDDTKLYTIDLPDTYTIDPQYIDREDSNDFPNI